MALRILRVIGRSVALAALPALAVVIIASRALAQPGITCNLLGPRHPCEPYLLYPPGQDLRLTVESRATGANAPASDSDKLDTLRDLFAALRACWAPPPLEDGRAGMEVSVRLSFDRAGNIIGKPRFTYATPAASQEQRELYRRAVIESLERCTPLPLTKGLGGAIAGRPIAIRYIDNRDPPRSTT
jgi:hypothetical protein